MIVDRVSGTKPLSGRILQLDMESLRVAIYARVSTEKQDFAGQVEELRTYAQRAGWEATEYLEKESAKAGSKRPMLIKLLARSNTVTSKTYAANILTGLTGQSLGIDPHRWENWLQARSGDKNKDKQKK